MEGMKFITGSYFTYTKDENGITPLGWKESTKDYSDIKNSVRDYELWVLVYSDNRINPLGKKWIPTKCLDYSDTPARYPRPQLPDTFQGNRVIQAVRMDPRIVGAIRDGYPQESGLNSWTGWRYRLPGVEPYE